MQCNDLHGNDVVGFMWQQRVDTKITLLSLSYVLLFVNNRGWSLPHSTFWDSSVSMTTGQLVRLRFIFFFKTLEPSGVHSTYSVGARGTFPRGKLDGV